MTPRQHLQRRVTIGLVIGLGVIGALIALRHLLPNPPIALLQILAMITLLTMATLFNFFVRCPNCRYQMDYLQTARLVLGQDASRTCTTCLRCKMDFDSEHSHPKP